MRQSFNVTALFGGVGGLELGLQRHGHHTSLFCECDPEATAVLARRFPSTPLMFDVRATDELREAIHPKSNLLTAGFPCTDLSQAGRTEGFAGDKSSLVRDVIKLLKKRPFEHVLIENVPNWRHLHGGAYLREVLSALERLGYRWAYRTIDALAFGLPQRRHRIFVYATLEGDPRGALFFGDEEPDEQVFALDEQAHGFYWTEGNRGLGWGEDCVPTLKGGSAVGIPAPPAIVMPDLTIITPDVSDTERLQGFAADWTNVQECLPRFEGRAFKQRRRWMLVGNAVNVEVSAWIGEQLAAQRRYDGEEDVVLGKGDPWPTAAWYDGRSRWRASKSLWPVKRKRRHLASFLLQSAPPLSLRATEGFYSRLANSSLNVKRDFLQAVKRHLERMKKTPVAPKPKSKPRKSDNLRRVA
ncbi:MAG TPA: DNA (cytosine-5-)-methyltransferase [Stellaceae bacterium]|jgi:DNA (cytosine-5)-methyltransferase 1|nr:DNA (cytosine-5-)-methyltransferase [Stellaceae bacterium]